MDILSLDEVFYICEYLSLREVKNLTVTCKRFSTIVINLESNLCNQINHALHMEDNFNPETNLELCVKLLLGKDKTFIKKYTDEWNESLVWYKGKKDLKLLFCIFSFAEKLDRYLLTEFFIMAIGDRVKRYEEYYALFGLNIEIISLYNNIKDYKKFGENLATFLGCFNVTPRRKILKQLNPMIKTIFFTSTGLTIFK